MKLLRVARVNFLRWCEEPKYTVVIVYLSLYSFDRFRGLADYTRDLGHFITPWTLPFWPCMSASFLPLILGFVLMVADAPFRTQQQILIMQRIGKRKWLAGQLVYLLAVSLGFTVLMWILSWLWLLPRLAWENEWGATLITITMSGIPGNYGVFMRFPYALIKSTSPITVTLWCMASMAAICYLIGVIMTACNLWLRKGWGAIIISALTAIALITNANAIAPGLTKMIIWFSPLNWMDYSLMGHETQYLPSHAFGIYCPALLGVALSLVLIFTVGKCDVDIEKE